jgi:hypothetical protein
MRLLPTLLLAAATACASDAARCGLDGSTFLVSYTQINGDCGELDPRLSMPGENVPDECDQTIEHENSCAASVRRTCKLANGDQTNFMHRLKPASFGFEGTAQATILSSTPGVGCSGLYAARFVKQ